MNSYAPTPSQTIGPYFAYSLTPEQYGYDYKNVAGANPVDPYTPESCVHIVGRILDGKQQPVADALVELFPAVRCSLPQSGNLSGSQQRFPRFGRMGTGTDPLHRFHFVIAKPVAVGAVEAPAIGILIFMRGLLKPLFTRMYFPEEIQRNQSDPVLNAVPQNRRKTLIAERSSHPTISEYRFNIILQGAAETVFFDLYDI